jgi:hypothetical protein
MAGDVAQSHRARLFDQKAEHSPTLWWITDRTMGLVVDPGGQESLEPGASLVEDAQRGVASTGDLTRALQQPAQDRLRVKLTHQSATGIKQATHGKIVGRFCHPRPSGNGIAYSNDINHRCFQASVGVAPVEDRSKSTVDYGRYGTPPSWSRSAHFRVDPGPAHRSSRPGNRRAAEFRVFYERHVQAVVAYVARRTREPDLVLDVVAETFARALEHRDQYDASRGPAVAWLFGIARNEIAGAVRRGRAMSAPTHRLTFW